MKHRYERVIEIARKIDDRASSFVLEGQTVTISDIKDLLDSLHTEFLDLPTDEPIFILRSTDRVAPRAIRAWTTWVESEGADAATIGSGLKREVAMREWQDDPRNRLKVKIPTAPPEIE
jgi:hypothetical protein